MKQIFKSHQQANSAGCPVASTDCSVTVAQAGTVVGMPASRRHRSMLCTMSAQASAAAEELQSGLWETDGDKLQQAMLERFKAADLNGNGAPQCTMVHKRWRGVRSTSES